VPLRSWYPVEVFHIADRPEAQDGTLVEDTRLRDALRTLRDQATDGSYAVPSAGTGAISFSNTGHRRRRCVMPSNALRSGRSICRALEEYVTELEQRVGWLEQRFETMLRAEERPTADAK